jgi:hypothetical protein
VWAQEGRRVGGGGGGGVGDAQADRQVVGEGRDRCSRGMQEVHGRMHMHRPEILCCRRVKDRRRRLLVHSWRGARQSRMM